ncbi:PREDICTED: E3 ubiquitin-protein ligase TRIM11-like [Nanorana parkeri]|uniref:E3 ubiquitin-protein ligase TRIM11-like n=1 Tax=Nanorana parkeri TaxID=125878 RepID=UPI0008540E65|nr:PREDICTED: E3 ubiquitin-protein ligase TRIM11-like [Nanorana parkeri]
MDSLSGEELECCICLNIYRDPVMLKCGHNFCRECINSVLDTQERSGGYSCPQCREKFPERPALHRNITLRNILEDLQSTQPGQEISGKVCTYCIHFPVPAVKSCLLCEAYLCDNHLGAHNKSPEHVLCDLTTSLENRKCSIHKKALKYYCSEDSVCVCVYCRRREHKGHKMKLLKVASEIKKIGLRKVLQTLTIKREETETRVQSLQEHRRKVQGKAAGETEKVTALFRDVRRQLEDLQKRVLSEISSQAEQISSSLSDLIRQLEIKKDELSKKMGHIEELCNKSDPLTVLQESDTGDLCDPEDGDNERERHDRLLHEGEDLDVAGMSHMFNTLSDIIKGTNVCFYVQKAADITLDVNTAHNSLQISDDKKTASWSNISQNRPDTPERFQSHPHVLSSQSFSSGRHYWDVDVGGSNSWRLGMCYPSMERKGRQSMIGCNKESWGIFRNENGYSVMHDCKRILLPDNISSDRVSICLDYEAGQISFYSLCDILRNLHTFNATFTEPLHVVLGVWNGSVKLCGGKQ